MAASVASVRGPTLRSFSCSSRLACAELVPSWVSVWLRSSSFRCSTIEKNSRRARYYALTAAGRRALANEQESWDRLSRAVNIVMRMAPE